MATMQVEILGTLAVSTMMICYAAEDRDPRFILGFALACVASAAYAASIGSMPFMLIELIWAGIAVRRWRNRRYAPNGCTHIIRGDS